ncbi:hypothetical protein KUTeg_000290 [Tegillarca granosa]|uniref:Uncharacterized protein n=1 Tax=Tegillarca granosa TaxID=220873 RepID=A0ABQ9FX48_TEGGR|nr:hypothetical protein KUTeg_000290 [Tegillarca granosa]
MEVQGSGLGAHSSPQSASHNTSQQIPVITQISLDPILHELMESKEQQIKLHNSLSVLTEEFQSYKSTVQQEISLLKHLLEIESVRSERLEEQINDMTELHQNESTGKAQSIEEKGMFKNSNEERFTRIISVQQDISSMEEKIEYRLDERTSDIHDLLENCQTRVTKMELQQQQQQIISMEMVESATFRTLLTKARILSTSVLIFSIVMTWRNWDSIAQLIITIWQYIVDILPQR